MIPETKPILEGKDLTKIFGSVIADDHIDFQLMPGEVHAVLGENGAGKTTLMNIFYGLLQPDEGKVLIHGKEVNLSHPVVAIRHGIGMVHQNLMLIPHLTVGENVVLGREHTRNHLFLDLAFTNGEILKIAKEYGLELDPDVQVEKLPIGIQQRVEIIKALYRQAEILILDEPTALLTPREIEDLFHVIRNLVKQNKSVIFITHKLKEVFQVADRITVLRSGRVVSTLYPSEINEQGLAELMVGKGMAGFQNDKRKKYGALEHKKLLEVEAFDVQGENGRTLLDDVTFDISDGEVLGVAGVEGNGQTELLESIVGLRNPTNGNITLNGHAISGMDIKGRRKLGIAIIPEDRQKLGLNLNFKVSENLVLNNYDQPPFANIARLNWKNIIEYAKQAVSAFDIRTSSVSANIKSLSGGNQQKVIVGRELSAQHQLLVASQPTRGVDVASVKLIHEKILEASRKGVAVLLISSDLDELMSICDRILVLYRGRVAGIMEASRVTKEALGKLMLGVA